MTVYEFFPKGVCCRKMNFSLNDNTIERIDMVGGCDGNLKGICKLAENRSIDEVIGLCKGITCGSKSTSCPDQMAVALMKFKEQR